MRSEHESRMKELRALAQQRRKEMNELRRKRDFVNMVAAGTIIICVALLVHTYTHREQTAAQQQSAKTQRPSW